jgi:integrase
MHADGGGLYLQVTKGKAEGLLNKSWLFRYERNNKERQMGLGSLNTIGLKEAREKAKWCRQVLLDGKDPIETRNAERAAAKAVKSKSATFEWCSVQYLKKREIGWRNAKSRAQWTSTLRAYVYPIIGKVPVDAITTDMIVKILAPIWATKNETASRIRGRIKTILDWAKVNGYRTGENPAAWRGHFEHILPARKDVHEVEHHPALPYALMSEFMTELRRQEGLAAKCLEFTILTAARSGESRGLPWEAEIKGNIWTAPAARMKGGRQHVVPLSKAALAVIDYMREVRQNDIVFPGDSPDAPMSDMSLTAVIRRMNEARAKAGLPMWVDPNLDKREITVHGFRSSFKDWATDWEPSREEIIEAAKRGELLETFPRDMIEIALAHRLDSKTEEAYRRAGMIERRRRMMETWAKFCAGALGEVTETREAADSTAPTLLEATAP